MPDTKVSGLTAAASFLTTHEIPVNEAGTSKKVTGAQVLAATSQGTLGYVQVTANQTPITTLVDLTSLTLTITYLATRRIRITGITNWSTTVNADSVQVTIVDTAGPTVLATANVGLVSTGQVFFGYVTAVIVPGAGAKTIKLQAARVVGSGSETMGASATQPAFLLIEDIGV